MSRSFRYRRPVSAAIVLAILLVSLASGRSAYATPGPDWFGWGVHVDFANNTWRVLYITYIGRNAPGPQVIGSSVTDISSHCDVNPGGTLSFPTPDSAFFDGKTYIVCDLPDLRQGIAALGYLPPSGMNPVCPCAMGAGPFWVDAHVRQLNPSSGSMPLFDAGNRGVRMNLVVNGNKVRTQLGVAQSLMPVSYTVYTSPEQVIDPAGTRHVMGWYGPGVVRVADHFGWLNYLTDPGWRTFFKTSVVGDQIGYWHESPTASGTTTLSSGYELGMDSGTLYIGYSPSSGKYFQGELIEGGIEPGCKGS